MDSKVDTKSPLGHWSHQADFMLSTMGYAIVMAEDHSDSNISEMDSKVDTKSPRGHWSHQAEFILSSMGYAIGLGNLWRFPYLCMRNGGGAFLIPYWIFMVLCGLPMFFLELVLGQFSGLSPLKVWKICPIFSGIGWGMVIVSAIYTFNYNMLFGWVLYYLGLSFQSQVPWISCGNTWNTPSCQSVLDKHSNESVGNASLKVTWNLNDTLSNTANRTAAEEYFLYKVLNISPGIDDLGGIQWQLLLALLAAVVLTYLAMCQGIKSSGKVAYVTATAPYVLLTILLIRGVTLPGSLEGIKYYIIPDWSKLLEFKVWTEACLQVFFTLGPGWGGIITLASYNRFHNNCFRDALVVLVTCGGTSFYAGFIIFSIVGFMAHEIGKPIEDVIAQGPSLAFVAYPEAISHMPWAPFWAVCFFLVLATLGIDSQFGMLETVISSIIDVFPDALRKRKMLFVAAVSAVMFILGLPLTTRGGLYLFQLIDWYSIQFSLATMALLECVLVTYIYGIGRFYADMTLVLRRRPSVVWAVCWCGVTPGLLIVILVVSAVSMTPPVSGDYVFPRWSEIVGLCLMWAAIVPIPLVALYKMIVAKGTLKQRLHGLVNPTSDWLPVEEKYHSKYKQMFSGTTWRQRFRLQTNPHLDIDHMIMEDVHEKEALNGIL